MLCFLRRSAWAASFLSGLLAVPAALSLPSSIVAAEEATSDSQGQSDRLDAGIDSDLFSETTPPSEDFYQYANAGWLDKTEIPGDRSNYGIFTVLSDRTEDQVRTLIEAAAEALNAETGTPTQKVGDLYQSYLDLSARNAAGIQPIEDLLQRVRHVDSKEQLGNLFGMLERAGVGHLFASYVSPDARDSDSYAVYLTQSGITLPDRDYYLSDEPRYQELRQQLEAYIREALTALGHDSPAESAKAIVELETKIAQAHWTKVENRDPVKTYNKREDEQMQKLLGQLPWSGFAEQTGIDVEEDFIMRQPSFFTTANELLEDVSLQTWQEYLQFRVFDAYAAYLTEELEKLHFAFHETAISGVTEQMPLWKRGVQLTGSVLGELVGQLYVEKHFTPQAKQRMGELVDNLKQAFAKRVKTLDWMGEGTKKQALEKLGKFTTKIGYPDEWKDYEKLKINPNSLVENLRASAQFEHQRQIDKLGGPIDRNEWHMTPQTINAYYNPTMNEIVFPAAILQPPFFNMAADDAINYGAIGAVIGHELSHGFDDKGSQYDGNGNLRDWWTPEDRQEFEARAEGLVKQYSQFSPFPDMQVNGELTLGENIGDLGGLNVAYHAYKLSLEGKPAPVIDGLTGDQRFFLGWAQIWRRLYREPELRRRLLVDPHSPSRYRVNGIVTHMDAFYHAFDIQPDSPMYLPPEKRVRIW